ELSPGNLLGRHGAGVGAVAGGGVGDLAEIGPVGGRAAEVLVEHGDHADGEVAGDPAADLKEADGGFGGVAGVPFGELDHVLDPGPDGVDIADVALDAVGRVDVAERGI